MSEKKYIYVEKNIAEQYEKCESDNSKIAMFKEYIEKHRMDLKSEYEQTLSCMEEDLLMFTGLNLSVRESFKKAALEAEKASYELWEKYDKEKISIEKKVSKLCDEIKPIKKELEEINSLLNSVKTYPFDRIIETLRAFNSLTNESKEMMQFLFDNYKQERE